MTFTFLPLTVATWNDLVELFGHKGACGGCWCMYWRLKAADYDKQKGEGNKKAMKKLQAKSSPGIIAYTKGKAIGWCAVAPRDEYIRLETSRILKPVDDKKVWSVSCFFITKEFRGKRAICSTIEGCCRFCNLKRSNHRRRIPNRTNWSNGRCICVDGYCFYLSKSRV